MLFDLRILAVDTGRLFWRLLPQLLTLYLLGWLANQLTLKVATIVGDYTGWGALAIFSFSFLFTLTATVLILRICGQELGIEALLPSEEAASEGRGAGLTQAVGVTLLPFLALYAAFGQVQQTASRLATEQLFRNSIFGEHGVLGTVRGEATDHPWRLVLILLVLYVGRRLLDVAQERTGRAGLGLAGALVESFFLLVVILGGFVLFSRVQRWWADRLAASWVDRIGAGVHRALAAIQERLPVLVDQAWAFTRTEILPAVGHTLGEPIVWLAVAALVFGSRVLSVAELWRRGQSALSHVPGATVFSRRAERLARDRIGPAPTGVRHLASQFSELFLGDVSDKYLPTFHSLRLVLRAGGVFVGAYVLLYSLLTVAKNLLTQAIHFVVGGRDVAVWFVADPFTDLLENVPLELLRLCLLAVAFRRCLEIFQLRTHSSPTFPPPDLPPPDFPPPTLTSPAVPHG